MFCFSRSSPLCNIFKLNVNTGVSAGLGKINYGGSADFAAGFSITVQYAGSGNIFAMLTLRTSGV